VGHALRRTALSQALPAGIGAGVLFVVPAVAVAILTTSCTRDLAAPSNIAPTPVPGSPSNPQPAPQRTIMGQVREVNGGALAGVTITAYGRTGQAWAQVASTGADGSFRLEQFAGDALGFSENGHEPREWVIPQNAKPDETLTITVKMQPVLRVSPGSMIASVLTQDDLTYSAEGGGGDTELFWEGDYLCGRCKLIFAPAIPAGGTLRLSWSGVRPLTLWAGDYYSGPFAVVTGKPGESELVVPIPAGRPFNTAVLVGFDHQTGFTGGTIAFKLELEEP
jgi:hypothetical protein